MSGGGIGWDFFKTWTDSYESAEKKTDKEKFEAELITGGPNDTGVAIDGCSIAFVPFTNTVSPGGCQTIGCRVPCEGCLSPNAFVDPSMALENPILCWHLNRKESSEYIHNNLVAVTYSCPACGESWIVYVAPGTMGTLNATARAAMGMVSKEE